LLRDGGRFGPSGWPIWSEKRRQLSTGFTGLSLTDLTGCGKVIGQGDRDASLLRSCRSYERKFSALPGNLDTTKTSGMGYCCLTTLRRNTPFHSVFGSVRGYSTSLDLVSRGHAGRLAKPILFCRKPLKKLLPMDERPCNPTLVRGRSPFPAAQQSDQDVGTQGTTAPRTLAFGPRQSRLLWSAQLENRVSGYQGGAHFQCRDLRRVCPLSSSIDSRENTPYSGQCKMAQSARFERVFLRKSGSDSTYFPATIFPRTQSSGTGLENHSAASDAQPLFPIGRRSQNRFNILFYEMGAAKQYA